MPQTSTRCGRPPKTWEVAEDVMVYVFVFDDYEETFPAVRSRKRAQQGHYGPDKDVLRPPPGPVGQAPGPRRCGSARSKTKTHSRTRVESSGASTSGPRTSKEMDVGEAVALPRAGGSDRGGACIRVSGVKGDGETSAPPGHQGQESPRVQSKCGCRTAET